MSTNSITDKNIITIDTRPGAPEYPIPGLAQLANTLVTQSNSLTNETRRLNSKVQTITEVLTVVTAGTIRNTKRVLEEQKALTIKK